MVNLATISIGPLAGPECRRALARGWVILVRVLAAVALLGAAMLAYWFWMIENQIDPNHRPYYELRIGLAVVEGMLVTLAIVMAPAVLAGSLAGERERGALAILMTTRVSSWEIVAGRMLGKLSQVGMIMLAGMPALVLLAGLAGLSLPRMSIYLLLPAAIAWGSGGLATAASTISRRGRDALLSVYLVDLFFMLGPLSSRLGLPPGVFDAIAALNPYNSLIEMSLQDYTRSAWLSIWLWLSLGVVGSALASWRLRPSCVAAGDGERSLKKSSRRAFVPAMNERRPMLWKEIFVERVATLGRFGKWMGALLVFGLGGGSLGLTGVIAWERYKGRDPVWAMDELASLVGATGGLMSGLIQWAIGLRAAVSISSERERGTWDALLTSTLEPGEIVWGKVWGSLLAIRWLLGAALLAWILAVAMEALPTRVVLPWALNMVVIGAFMAAVGVRTSLNCATATRAMSLTIGIWLGAYVVAALAAFFLLAVGILLCNAGWVAASQAGIAPPLTTIWLPLPGYVAWPLATNSLFIIATLIIVTDTRLRFDRMAGRMTEGGVSGALDEMLYGRPEAPELLEAENGLQSEREDSDVLAEVKNQRPEDVAAGSS